jgi:MFS transporter, CP family, cyanate transporter
MAEGSTIAIDRRSRLGVSLALLWLSGVGLRLTVLAVPPVVLLIKADLALSGTEMGILAGLPLLLFALAAVPGSLLIARFGAVTALVVGLLLTALGGAARGLAPNSPVLFAMTVLMGTGVAIMQPSLPPLVRAWLSDRIGLATAVYTNGLLLGEILVVLLTGPFVLPLVGGDWRPDIALWSLPVAATALAVWALAPRVETAAPAAPRRWWPDWRDPMLWRLGFVLGSVNASYFSTNQFLPVLLESRGLSQLMNEALTLFNASQLLASLVMLPLTGRLLFRRWAYSGTGLLSLAGILGIALSHSAWVLAWLVLMGFASAAILILVLGLPPSLCPPADVHRLTAAMFTVSYGSAVVVALLAGLALDATGAPAAPFLPITLCGVVTVLLPLTLDFRRRG